MGVYGPSAETENLLALLFSHQLVAARANPSLHASGSGFLPSKYQGVQFHSKGDPVLYLGNPRGVTRETNVPS